MNLKSHFGIAITLLATLIIPQLASAHCDTMDGPVIADARLSLVKGDVTLVLKWIKPEAETEIKEIFVKTMAARKAGDAPREVTDLWFFENLVRIHRAGEGAPFTGLRQAGTEADPAVKEADEALTSGNVAPLAKAVSELVAHSIAVRFEKVQAASKTRDQSVEAGRQYVEAYVDYVHFVENAANLSGAHHHGAEGEESENGNSEESHHQH